jgi:hypothetical protein
MTRGSGVGPDAAQHVGPITSLGAPTERHDATEPGKLGETDLHRVVICTECGARDTLAVKPGKYFCKRCESVFGQPDVPTGDGRDGLLFCGCGNAIEVRCNVCRTSLCRRCDVKSVAETRAFDSRHRVFVSVQGFGYLIRSMDVHYLVIGNRLVWQRCASGEILGPVLAFTKLIDALPGHGEQYHHLCWACVAAAAPEVADRVSTGLVCEEPACTNRPVGRCRCCNGALCAHHLKGKTALQTTISDPEVCPNCVNEHVPAVWFSRPADRAPIDPQPAKWRTRRALATDANARRERQAEASRLLAQELSARVIALHTAGPCQRDRLVDEGLPHGMSYAGFRLLDERDGMRVAALGTVTAYP